MPLASIALAPPRAGPPVVVIAASVGGLAVLKRILARLPAETPAAVLVVLHRAPERPNLLPRVLARSTVLPVREPRDGERLQPGVVYVCAADRTTVIDADGSLRVAAPSDESRPRPRADAVLHSVAAHAGANAIAVILTGYGCDGAEGAAEVYRRGGRVLVQAPSSCEAAGMPQAALDAAGADFVLRPEAIANALATLLLSPAISATLFGAGAGRWRYRLRQQAVVLS